MNMKYAIITGVHVGVLEWVEAKLQETKPGKYTVIETRTSNVTYEYTLVFDDPKEELFWRLKYG
jgi:hypothetical protein